MEEQIEHVIVGCTAEGDREWLVQEAGTVAWLRDIAPGMPVPRVPGAWPRAHQVKLVRPKYTEACRELVKYEETPLHLEGGEEHHPSLRHWQRWRHLMAMELVHMGARVQDAIYMATLMPWRVKLGELASNLESFMRTGLPPLLEYALIDTVEGRRCDWMVTRFPQRERRSVGSPSRRART